MDKFWVVTLSIVGAFVVALAVFITFGVTVTASEAARCDELGGHFISGVCYEPASIIFEGTH